MNNKPKILIVDDDIFLLDMYALKFREAGFDVDVAAGGEEALEKIKNKDYSVDVMLLDIVMPRMDGFELLRVIKDKKFVPNAAIIALTNLGQKEDIEKGKHLGVKDYIIKAHFTPTEVVKKVKEILSA
jgi:DNA-binding response OmpR family regulator